MAEKTVETIAKPVQVKRYPQADTQVCVYCTLCARKCPEQAITVDRSEKVWSLNKDDCISCGLCQQNCPKKCIAMKAD